MLSDPIISLFIFCFVVFIYIHISAEWKKSQDLEVYESPFTTPSHLAEICDIKQPVIFTLSPEITAQYHSKMQNLQKHAASDVLVKDMREYMIPGAPAPEPVILPLDSAKRLVATDSGEKYLAEQNDAFLEETGLAGTFGQLDWALRPHACIANKYDYVFGSAGAHTPYRYHTHSRMFVLPIVGRVRVRLAPWKMTKHMWAVKDYEMYEFRSNVEPWSGSTTKDIKSLDVDVLPGQMLFIPQYWWYSIKLTKGTELGTFVYNTAINGLANAWDWTQYFLQQNNVTQRIVAPLSELETKPNEIPALDSVPITSETNAISPEFTELKVINSGENEIKTSEPKEIITNAGTYTV